MWLAALQTRGSLCRGTFAIWGLSTGGSAHSGCTELCDKQESFSRIKVRQPSLGSKHTFSLWQILLKAARIQFFFAMGDTAKAEAVPLYFTSSSFANTNAGSKTKVETNSISYSSPFFVPIWAGKKLPSLCLYTKLYLEMSSSFSISVCKF